MSDSVDMNKVRIVKLAGKDYIVKRVPMARIKRIENVLANTVAELQKEINLEKALKDPKFDTSKLLGNVMDKLLQFPHAILSLFIDDLPLEIFLDEENGVDLPDFVDAVKVALTLNRVDILKNVFSRLMPKLIETQNQARDSRKTS